jgi:hypothetical protein
MEDTHFAINTNVAYERLSFSQKIVIPIEDGKFGIWKYKQHKTDPLSAEKIKIGYAGEDRIKIQLRLTGQLDINNFPDLRVGGTKVHIEAGLAFEAGKLCIIHPELTRLDVPNVLNLVDNLLRDVLNKHLLKPLTIEPVFEIKPEGIQVQLLIRFNQDVTLTPQTIT